MCCTALTASRHNLLNIDLDWCIIDEAGQINQPTIIGPLLKAKRYVRSYFYFIFISVFDLFSFDLFLIVFVREYF